MTARPRDPNTDAVAIAVTDLLFALGFNLEPGDDLWGTPDRVSRSWAERLDGYQDDAQKHLAKVFQEDEGDSGLVVLRDIEFHSTCEHHLLPFSGVAHVGYVPRGGKVVGLSKLVRVVEVFAHRLQLQERLTRDVASSLDEHLDPLGVGVVIEASHGCMVCRGVRQQRSRLVTSVLIGVLLDLPEARAEFMRIALGGR